MSESGRIDGEIILAFAACWKRLGADAKPHDLFEATMREIRGRANPARVQQLIAAYMAPRDIRDGDEVASTLPTFGTAMTGVDEP